MDQYCCSAATAETSREKQGWFRAACRLGLQICDVSCPRAAAAQALKKAAFQKKGLSVGLSCIGSAKDYLLARLSYLCILNKSIHVTNLTCASKFPCG